jgi:chromosome segregation ATPase
LLYAERRVVGLKKGIEELRSELDAANAEVEDAKRAKETAEQELKGYEVELARNEVSIQTPEVLLLRISCQFVIEFLLNLIQSSQIVFNVITFDFFQARIYLIQDEISAVGSDLEALKVLSRLLFSPIFLCGSGV